jgi:hypothetical protein
MADRERGDPVELPVEERVARDNERAYVLGEDCRKCILEITFADGVEGGSVGQLYELQFARRSAAAWLSDSRG